MNEYYWVSRWLDICKITIILVVFNEEEQKFTLLIFIAIFWISSFRICSCLEC